MLFHCSAPLAYSVIYNVSVGAKNSCSTGPLNPEIHKSVSIWQNHRQIRNTHFRIGSSGCSEDRDIRRKEESGRSNGHIVHPLYKITFSRRPEGNAPGSLSFPHVMSDPEMR